MPILVFLVSCMYDIFCFGDWPINSIETLINSNRQSLIYPPASDVGLNLIDMVQTDVESGIAPSRACDCKHCNPMGESIH